MGFIARAREREEALKRGEDVPLPKRKSGYRRAVEREEALRRGEDDPDPRTFLGWAFLDAPGLAPYLANKGLEHVRESRDRKAEVTEFTLARYGETKVASLTPADFEKLAEIWPDAYEAVLALVRDGRASSVGNLSLADLVSEAEG